MKNDALEVWKSFLCGHNPVPLQYAGKIDVAKMEPRGDLSSTGYVLASVGKEYLVLNPGELTAPFTLMLEEGVYEVEWHNVNSRKTIKAANLKVESIVLIGFKAPFESAGPEVLYLRGIN